MRVSFYCILVYVFKFRQHSLESAFRQGRQVIITTCEIYTKIHKLSRS